MAELVFENLSFEKEKEYVKVTFLRNFYFYIPNDDLESIGKFTVEKNKMIFRDINEKSAGNKFRFLLDKCFKNLKNKITGKDTVYIHKNSCMPLIGNSAFGIIDRNSSLIEIKPITGCNLDCIFCSIDLSRRERDFVIEKDYIIDEFKKLVDFKGISGIEAHLNAHGEPTSYADLVPLVRDLAEINQVERISMDTNATLISKKLADELIEAGLTSFNISLNAMDKASADMLAGASYNLDQVKELCRHISGRVKVMIAPVWVPGINDEEIPEIIRFSKENGFDIGIQNFMEYKNGKTPSKQKPWDNFINELRELEKRFNVKLLLSDEDFSIKNTKNLPKPFKKGDVINAKIRSDGIFRKEKIAVASGRSVSVPNCYKCGNVRIKITRSKHNIFYGVVV